MKKPLISTPVFVAICTAKTGAWFISAASRKSWRQIGIFWLFP
jgi:hypothetical protein